MRTDGASVWFVQRYQAVAGVYNGWDVVELINLEFYPRMAVSYLRTS